MLPCTQIAADSDLNVHQAEAREVVLEEHKQESVLLSVFDSMLCDQKSPLYWWNNCS